MKFRYFSHNQVKAIKPALIPSFNKEECGLEFRTKCMYAGVMLDELKKGFTDEKEVIVDEHTLNALDDALVARYVELSGSLIYKNGDLIGTREEFSEDSVNVLAAMATVLGCEKALADYLHDETKEFKSEK